MTPLLIHPDHAHEFLTLSCRIKKGERLELPGASFAMNPAAYADGMTAQQVAMEELRNSGWLQPYMVMTDPKLGIATITLSGPVYQLTEREESWYCDYVIANRLAMSAVKRAMNDPEIKGVRLRVNSPGGQLTGTFELSRAVKALAAAKPVFTSVDSMAASSAQAIISGGGSVYASPSAIVGSVGVFGVHLDYSKTFQEFYATDFTLIRAGDHKAESFRAMDEPMKARWTKEILGTAAELKQLVQDHRGVTIDDSWMQGQGVSGPDALTSGLVDALVDDPDEAALESLRMILDSESE